MTNSEDIDQDDKNPKETEEVTPDAKEKEEPTEHVKDESASSPDNKRKVQFSEETNGPERNGTNDWGANRRRRRLLAAKKEIEQREELMRKMGFSCEGGKDPRKFGKADLRRDLTILIGFVVVAAFFCLTSLRDVGKVTEEESELSKHQNRLEKLAQAVENQSRQRKRGGVSINPGSGGSTVKMEKSGSSNCQLYLAKSSIPGAGWGLFAGKSFDRDGIVLEQSLAYPTHPMMRENELKDSVSFVPMDVIMLKPHPDLANMIGFVECEGDDCSFTNKDDYVETAMDQPGTKTKNGLGRTTEFVALRYIEAGEELFIPYDTFGRWMESIPSWLKSIPEEKHYMQADEIVQDIANLPLAKAKIGGRSQAIGAGTNMGLIQKIVARFDERTATLIPRERGSLSRASKFGVALTAIANRTVKELSAGGAMSGICVDGLERRPSTIGEHAGYGAFASRSFHIGEIVVPVPLYVVAHSNDGKSNKKKKDSWTNYCLGRKDLSIRFCLTSPGAFINHAPTETDFDEDDENDEACAHDDEKECSHTEPRKEANAEFRWSSWNKVNEERKELDDVLEHYRVGLSLDVIATRNILKGEEVLIDYGKEWERAWEKYLKRKSEDENEPPFRQLIGMNIDLIRTLTIGR